MSDQDLIAWLAHYLQRCDGNHFASALREATEILSHACKDPLPAEADVREAAATSPEGCPPRGPLLRRCIAIASSRHRRRVGIPTLSRPVADSEELAAGDRSASRCVVPETRHQRMSPNDQPTKLWFVHWSGWWRRTGEVYRNVLELTAA